FVTQIPVDFHYLFCSSRRRHTRSKRDWSSDVCSSDLVPVSARTGEGLEELEQAVAALYPAGEAPAGCLLANARQEDAARRALGEIGRASCRGRGGVAQGAGDTQQQSRRTPCRTRHRRR